ncbi:MAG TPA: iron-containing alcohol dehydrogenase [Clostridia bacterium]|nr:iron-containing alcohol dehydrogenase [Clostridia bacterium]
MAKDFFTFLSAHKIVFGPNTLEKLPESCEWSNIKKPIIVTTGLKSTNIIERVRGLLPNCVVYDKVSPEPTSLQALECAELANEHGCDGFVGIGGGSSMDLAKTAAVVAKYGGRPLDYVGESNVPGGVQPIIAIPTTAGSGSEVTSVASLTHNDGEELSKAGLSDNYLRPTVALVDPALLSGLPKKFVAECGLDALAHGIEAFTAVDYKYNAAPVDGIFGGSNPISSHLAEKSIELIYKNLRTAAYQPENMEAKFNLALGSVLSGLGFGSAGLGAVHASYYAVSQKAGTTHAYTVGLMLPHVMKFNVMASPERYARIAKIIGVEEKGYSDYHNGMKAAEAIAELVVDVGLPANLSELSIEEKDVQGLAENAMKHDRLVRGNAKKMSVSEFEKLFRNSL